jgi:hypothetical protein
LVTKDEDYMMIEQGTTKNSFFFSLNESKSSSARNVLAMHSTTITDTPQFETCAGSIRACEGHSTSVYKDD